MAADAPPAGWARNDFHMRPVLTCDLRMTLPKFTNAPRSVSDSLQHFRNNCTYLSDNGCASYSSRSSGQSESFFADHDEYHDFIKLQPV